MSYGFTSFGIPAYGLSGTNIVTVQTVIPLATSFFVSREDFAGSIDTLGYIQKDHQLRLEFTSSLGNSDGLGGGTGGSEQAITFEILQQLNFAADSPAYLDFTVNVVHDEQIPLHYLGYSPVVQSMVLTLDFGGSVLGGGYDIRIPIEFVLPTSSFDNIINFETSSPFVTDLPIPIETPGPGFKYVFPPTVIFDTPGGHLPLGLSLSDDGKITGTISLFTPIGSYSFLVSATADSDPPIYRTFTMNVVPFNQAVATLSVFWVTLPGSLGSITEFTPSYFSVLAQASDNSAIQYSLAPGSLPLPPGMSLDAATGDIIGYANIVAADTIFTFTIRATSIESPFIYVDRTFTIKIIHLFTDELSNVNIALTGTPREVMSSFLEANINKTDLFRPTDPSYGIPDDMKMLIVGGLKQVNDETFWQAMQPLSTGSGSEPFATYHRKFLSVFGAVKSAAVRNDSGDVIYEVLYMEVVDPAVVVRGDQTFGPGGFSNGTPLLLPYAQAATTTSGIEHLFPTSIQNYRKDLISKIGFGSVEYLPPFLTSPQIAGDTTSSLGWIPALPIAYVAPGASSKYITFFSNNPVPITDMVFTMDRYLRENNAFAETTFDNNTTTFDSSTVFDENIALIGKYFNFPSE